MNVVSKNIRLDSDNFVLLDAISPIQYLLEDPNVVEISINRPNQVFVETLGQTHMVKIDIPELNSDRIKLIGERTAGATKQSINSSTPILSGSIDIYKARIQIVLPPAAPEGGAISIRKQVLNDFSLDQYREMGAFDHVVRTEETQNDIQNQLNTYLSNKEFYNFIKFAIENRQTIMVSGGTSSGKTTFLNACLKSVNKNERIITIEDTRELLPPQSNVVNLVASKGGQGEANVSMQDLLEATLRMRPDRLFVGEIRGTEAFTFLQAINTGHPGSMSTIHANDPRMAYERLAMMMMQSGLTNGYAKDDLINYIKMVIPIVVQVKNMNGIRGVSEISYTQATL